MDKQNDIIMSDENIKKQEYIKQLEYIKQQINFWRPLIKNNLNKNIEHIKKKQKLF